MPKTIIINENVVKKLNEAIEVNQLPKHLRLAILRGKTPLSNNKCFPYEGYLEQQLTATFKALSDLEVVRDGKATPEYLTNIERVCQEIERPVRNRLERLVSLNVTKLFGIPNDKIDYSIALVDAIDQSKTTIPFGPNENMPGGLSTVGDIEIIVEEADKRKIQNALIAGAAAFYTDILLSSVTGQLDEIDNRLFDFYSLYLMINDYLLFTEEAAITEEDKHQTGSVLVTLGNDETKNQMESQGIILPILFYETIKGFFEIFTAHGIPSNEAWAKAVISKTDYYLAEPWYMRMGKTIWGAFHELLPEISHEKKTIPWILMKISQLPGDKYIALMKEILAKTKKAREVLKRVYNWAKEKSESTEQQMVPNQNSDSMFMINDNA